LGLEFNPLKLVLIKEAPKWRGLVIETGAEKEKKKSF
jgi:hypothetical protein